MPGKARVLRGGRKQEQARQNQESAKQKSRQSRPDKAILWLAPAAPNCSCSKRTAFREKYGLRGSPCQDCCCFCCSPLCWTCQDANELMVGRGGRRRGRAQGGELVAWAEWAVGVGRSRAESFSVGGMGRRRGLKAGGLAADGGMGGMVVGMECE